jgi:type VI secretion system Hcp family effector
VGDTQNGRRAATPRAAPAGRRSGPLGSVLSLQRMAGNRAVAGLMRQPTGTGKATPTHGREPTQMLVTISAHTQGKLKGTGKDGAIEAWSFHLAVTRPTDVATGQASGARQYRTIKFKKPLDGASPQLMNALVNNETLDEVRFDFLPNDKATAGAPKASFETIVLKNAAVASLEQDSDESSDYVSLTFESIEMSNSTEKTTASDKWSSGAQ